MKQLLIIALLAASTIGAVAASSQAYAGNKGDYAKEYCRFYKNKAVWTGDRYWWDVYYSCLRENR